MGRVTVLDGLSEWTGEGEVRGGRLVLPDDSLEAALGFERKPEGLCKDEVCIVVRPGSGLETPDGRIDVTALAEALGRPVAVDEHAQAAVVGEAAANRAAALRSLRAPDFTLPDLDGRMHSLSEHRGKKVVLAAYASW